MKIELVMDVAMCVLAHLAFLCAGVGLAMFNADSLTGTTPAAWLIFAWMLVGVVAALFLIEQHRTKHVIKSASSATLDAT